MGKRLIGSVGLKPGTDTGFDLDEKGQIHGYSDTQFALPVGDDNQVLTSLASEASGLKWADASSSWVATAESALAMAGYDITNIGTAHADAVEILGGIKFTELFKKFEADFSADELDPRFTFTDVAGTGSRALDTGIDGVELITSGGSDNNISTISLNNQSNFNLALHTQYGIMREKDNSGAGEQRALQGLSDGTDVFGAGSNAVSCSTSGSDEIILLSSNGSGISTVGSGVDSGSAKFAWKIITNGTNMRLYLISSNIWSLKATKTNNKPGTVAGQPIGAAKTSGAAAEALMIRYYCQNDG